MVIDRTDQFARIAQHQQGAMPLAHAHVALAFDLMDGMVGYGTGGILGQQEDIAGMPAETAGAAGDAIKLLRGQFGISRRRSAATGSTTMRRNGLYTAA